MIMRTSKAASFRCSFTLAPSIFRYATNETSSPHSYNRMIEHFDARPCLRLCKIGRFIEGPQYNPATSVVSNRSQPSPPEGDSKPGRPWASLEGTTGRFHREMKSWKAATPSSRE
jgi:hypothetical protein